MISDKELPELAAFRKYESKLPFRLGPELGPLVAPTLNEARPIHRWFRFKESYSPTLVQMLIEQHRPSTPDYRILDPFCGVATTLVASQELSAKGKHVEAIGIERNPLIRLIARTKAAWPSIPFAELIPTGLAILKRTQGFGDVPRSTSFTTERCMSRHTSGRLSAIRAAIERVDGRHLRNALLVGLAASVEGLSKTRKDGRALRLVDRDRRFIADELSRRWEMIADDCRFMQTFVPQAKPATVLKGDGRRPHDAGVAANSIDLIITSPPYPNNIDYTEVYKLELWMLGLVDDGEGFLKLRKQTFRSHPTALRAPADPEFLHLIKTGRLRDLLWPVAERTRDMKERWRLDLVLGYFEDLWIALRNYRAVLKADGVAAFVVGNSLHGASSAPYVVPTDLILAALAERCGFVAEEVTVARGYKRRLAGNHFLRETLVTVRKTRG